MTFQYRPATRDRIGLLFGVAGASGSGKTYSALLLGQGIANGSGQLAVLDTEAARAKHYADKFKFLHCDFEPPFEPKRYVEAIRAAEDAGATVTMIDSMSHEWAGEGGCSDMQAREAERMATNKQGKVVAWKIEAMTAPAWKRPKIEHKRMMARLLQMRTHMIFCLRAEDKVRFEKQKDDDGRERTVITPIGFQPICEKSFMFEMSGFVTLHPDTPGVVRYDLPHKLNNDLRRIFPDGKPITRAAGAALREWAEQGADTRASAEDQRILDGISGMIERIEDTQGLADLEAITGAKEMVSRVEWLRKHRPALAERLDDVINKKLGELHAPSDAEDSPDGWDEQPSNLPIT